ncbi:MAG: glutathione S-transferase, partial [Loktanella sp.]|nr:glutathione S-transferase [Loktanella sp.]
MTYEGRLRPAEQQSTDWVEAQWKKANRGIAAINTRWMSHLSGPLDAAQIAVACALSYVDLRHDTRGWRDGNADLAAWYARFATRDSMIATAV